MTTQQFVRYSCFEWKGYRTLNSFLTRRLSWDVGQVRLDAIIKHSTEQWFCTAQSGLGRVFWRVEEQCQGRKEEWKSNGHLPACAPCADLWNPTPRWRHCPACVAAGLAGFAPSSATEPRNSSRSGHFCQTVMGCLHQVIFLLRKFTDKQNSTLWDSGKKSHPRGRAAEYTPRGNR